MPQLPASVHYLIGGAGPEHSRIAAAIKEHNLSDRVQLLGRLSDEDLLQLYHRADLLIVPNIPVKGDMEGFGIVMLEAGACGMPAIAARLEGIQDVISEGVNGHLVESRDAEGFIRAITPYVESPETLVALGTQARNHTQNRFGWGAIAARYVRVMERLRPRFTRHSPTKLAA